MISENNPRLLLTHPPGPTHGCQPVTPAMKGVRCRPAGPGGLREGGQVGCTHRPLSAGGKGDGTCRGRKCPGGAGSRLRWPCCVFSDRRTVQSSPLTAQTRAEQPGKASPHRLLQLLSHGTSSRKACPRPQPLPSPPAPRKPESGCWSGAGRLGTSCSSVGAQPLCTPY